MLQPVQLQQQQLTRGCSSRQLRLIHLLLVLSNDILRLGGATTANTTVFATAQVERSHLLGADTVEVAVGSADGRVHIAGGRCAGGHGGGGTVGLRRGGELPDSSAGFFLGFLQGRAVL